MSDHKRHLGLPFSEILRMAWVSVCAHKLRSALTRGVTLRLMP